MNLQQRNDQAKQLTQVQLDEAKKIFKESFSGEPPINTSITAIAHILALNYQTVVYEDKQNQR